MTKALAAFTGSVLLLASGGALAQANIAPETSLRLPPPPGAVGMAPENKAFINQALAAAATEIEIGRLAAQKARNAAVRDLGGQIANDQQAIKDALTRLSTEEGYNPQPGGAPTALAALAKLASSPANGDFDRQFLIAQQHASQWLLGAYQDEMASTQDQNLRTFAAQREILLRNHLKGVEKAAGAIGLKLEAPASAPQY